MCCDVDDTNSFFVPSAFRFSSTIRISHLFVQYQRFRPFFVVHSGKAGTPAQPFSTAEYISLPKSTALDFDGD